jgi:hypothetical protein
MQFVPLIGECCLGVDARLGLHVKEFDKAAALRRYLRYSAPHGASANDSCRFKNWFHEMYYCVPNSTINKLQSDLNIYTQKLSHFNTAQAPVESQQ